LIKKEDSVKYKSVEVVRYSACVQQNFITESQNIFILKVFLTDISRN